MARFTRKSFAQPDLLKQIHPTNLLRLLEPHRAFFEAKGFPVPSAADSIDYLSLAGILAQPDETMDSHLVEGLHIIGNLGRDEYFDELLEIARRNFIDTSDGETTAADLATRIWL